MSQHALIEQLKAADQDHEFYPTTAVIIAALVADVKKINTRSYGRNALTSVLDVGAGNGKVLAALGKEAAMQDLHAIEKSPILCGELPKDVLIVGTEFMEQSLISKEVDIVFCNPPYSEYEAWTEKIIREAAARYVYLVIPQRWERSERIKDALRFRSAEKCVTNIGVFNFEDAEDRTARAVVHLLRITLPHGEEHNSAFDCFFNAEFAELMNKFKAEETRPAGDQAEREGTGVHGTGEPIPKKEEPQCCQDITPGPNYPEAMVALYNAEMAKIHSNYQLVCKLDPTIMKELNISVDDIKKCLKLRLTQLKNTYWMELFKHLTAITDRLTTKSQKTLLERIHQHVKVDFTVSNIYTIVLWIIRNANDYIDSQLLEVYELMIDKCNVTLFKSNHKVWVEQRWRSREEPDKNSHYGLQYRIVTYRAGGIRNYYGTQEIDERAQEFMSDLFTIARNLGFPRYDDVQDPRLWHTNKRSWIPGKNEEFFFKNKAGEAEVLFDVKAFKNGNLHLRINQQFLLALNVEHGRLRGWIHTAQEAAEELDDPKAAQYFNTMLRLGTSNPGQLLMGSAAN